MPGKKRSDIKPSTDGHKAVALLPGKALRRSASAGREYRQSLCPACGVAHGYKRVTSTMPQGGEMKGLINYWEWLADRERELGYEKNPPFGVIQEVGRGKGHSLGVMGYFGPDDDPDGFFPLIKDRLLLVLRRWYDRDWIKEEELDAVKAKSI